MSRKHFMSKSITHFPRDVVILKFIINEVKNINCLMYDIPSKSLATIELK
ncbi:hypothetical protein ACQKM9_20170 [Viridibacillus sp. NPDC093762]